MEPFKCRSLFAVNLLILGQLTFLMARPAAAQTIKEDQLRWELTCPAEEAPTVKLSFRAYGSAGIVYTMGVKNAGETLIAAEPISKRETYLTYYRPYESRSGGWIVGGMADLQDPKVLASNNAKVKELETDLKRRFSFGLDDYKKRCVFSELIDRNEDVLVLTQYTGTHALFQVHRLEWFKNPLIREYPVPSAFVLTLDAGHDKLAHYRFLAEKCQRQSGPWDGLE